MNSYTRGSRVRVYGRFFMGATPSNPATIALKVINPARAETSYSYAGGQVIKEADGVYYYDLLLNSSGLWETRYETTGSPTTAIEGKLNVPYSPFT